MSRRTITECDRCTTIYDDDADRNTAGQIRAATFSGVDIAGVEGPEGAADLCGNCMGDLLAFMRGAEVVHPPAPPPPVATTRPKRKKQPQPDLQQVEGGLP